MGLGLTGLQRTVGRRYALCLVTCQLYRVVSVNKDLRWASSACVSSSLCRINQQPFSIRSRVSAVTEPGVSSSTMGREDNKSASLGGNLYLFISLMLITQLMFMCRAAQWSSVYLYQRHFNKMHKTKTSRREIISVLISRHSNFLKHLRTLGLFFLLVDEDHSKTDADRRTGSFNQSTLCTSAGSSTSVRLSVQTVLLKQSDVFLIVSVSLLSFCTFHLYVLKHNHQHLPPPLHPPFVTFRTLNSGWRQLASLWSFWWRCCQRWRWWSTAESQGNELRGRWRGTPGLSHRPADERKMYMTPAFFL